MKARLFRLMAVMIAAIALISPARLPAQEPPPPPPLLAPPQLDQLLAPIALYPDTLLTQILTASTHPLEVVEAARWVKDPNHAGLTGDQLAADLDQQDWDPSVKSLVPFPQVLQMMDGNLRWTQQLGDAFLAQQADVMDSVQRLRAQAMAAGTLRSTPQQVVIVQGSTIIIEPAAPDMVYVPAYSPTVVYGPWPYPDYPPDYFPPPAGYYDYGTGIVFGVGIGIVTSLWGWEHCDWERRQVHVDHDRFNRLNDFAIAHRHHPRLDGDTWDHDPYHRRGVPYRDSGSRSRFQAGSPGSPDARRDFRGYDHSQSAGPITGGAAVIPAPAGQPVVGPRTAMPVTEQPPVTQRARVMQQPPIGPRVPLPATQPQPMTQQSPIGPRVPAMQRPQPPAFEGMTRAPEVQRQIERARSSRQFLSPSMRDRSTSPPPAATPGRGAAVIPAPRGQPVVGPRTAPSDHNDQDRR